MNWLHLKPVSPTPTTTGLIIIEFIIQSDFSMKFTKKNYNFLVNYLIFNIGNYVFSWNHLNGPIGEYS